MSSTVPSPAVPGTTLTKASISASAMVSATMTGTCTAERAIIVVLKQRHAITLSTAISLADRSAVRRQAASARQPDLRTLWNSSIFQRQAYQRSFSTASSMMTTGRSVADTLERITGVRPVGLRTSSWDFSSSTLRIEQEMGLLYDSSLMADEDCYELEVDGMPSGIVEVPVEWVRDDAVHFMMNRFSALRPYTPPTDVLDIFRRELDAAWNHGGLFQLIMHPHVIASRSRIWILDELIRHAKAKGNVWFATHAEVAGYVRNL